MLESIPMCDRALLAVRALDAQAREDVKRISRRDAETLLRGDPALAIETIEAALGAAGRLDAHRQATETLAPMLRLVRGAYTMRRREDGAAWMRANQKRAMAAFRVLVRHGFTDAEIGFAQKEKAR